LNKLVFHTEETAEFIIYKNDPSNDNSLSNNNVKTICEDDKQNLWIGTIGGGINIYNPYSNSFERFSHNPQTAQSLSDDIIFHLNKDNSGIIWICTFSKGLNKFNPAKDRFIHYQLNPNTQIQIKDNDITATLIDKDSKLWIGTNGNGITVIENSFSFNKTELETKNIYRNDGDNTLSNNYVTSIIQDKDGFIWIGTFGGGLNKYDPKTKRFTVYKLEKNNPGSISHNFIHTIYEDKEGFLWIGTGLGGVCRYDKSTDSFKCYNYDPSDADNNKNPSSVEVTSICEDSGGYLWFGTSTGGINSFDRENQTFTYFKHHPENPASISSNRIVTIYEDKKSRLWIGTFSGGLNLLDGKSETFIHFTENEGLAGNTVMAITEDNDGNLWISTNKGISMFNPLTKTFKNFDFNDGLQGNEFNANSVFNDRQKNEIYFGGINGLNIFNSENIRDNLILPEIVITDFKLFNQSLSAHESSVLDRNILFADQIVLSHNENVISFEFSALHFMNPAKNKYAYKMEGFDRDWINAGTKRHAEYTNLDPGSYVFRVKGSNSDGIWNEAGASIKIIINPPFWRTWWAYLLYAIAIVAIFVTIRKFEMNRVKLRNELKLKDFEAIKLQEVDQLKSNFFANISHEFRTPLTIILGILKRSKKNGDESLVQKDFKTMERNASKLLHLINQLLELSKIESGSSKLSASKQDIIKFTKRILASFESLAYQKKQRLVFNRIPASGEDTPNELIMYFDIEKIETIIYNLLSNAIKFSPGGKTIEVELKEDKKYVKISVSNTGVEIPNKKLPHIFDRFYQVDDKRTKEYEGTGIGLSLVKEFIELHKGKVEVESENNKTTFTIFLPLGKSHLKADEIISEKISAEDTHQLEEMTLKETYEIKVVGESISVEAESTIILIVEDNADLRELIREHLEKDYSILEAENGKKGFTIAEDVIPDLIISDIMMPEMDGYELSRKIKNSEKTNHIPIILLTAKATTENKLEGLETGADDYLIKPFNPEELKIRVRNLIKIRQQIREKYQSQMLIKPAVAVIHSTQKLFIEKLTGIIEKHLNDDRFNVEDLCIEIAMSRAQLHRKIKAVVNLSTTEFIRNFRLQKAAELLKQDAGNIAEITYSVGFSSQAYFTKLFQEQFGCTPSEYKKRYQKKNVYINYFLLYCFPHVK